MNDRLKFRAWDTSLEKMFYPEGATIAEIIKWSNECEDGWWFNEAEDILIQCTGLKDKNGKLIFEGDVVAGKEGRFTEDVIGVVKYGALAFSFIGKTSSGKEWFYTITNPNYTQDSAVEIVGNKFENPDLLPLDDKQAK